MPVVLQAGLHTGSEGGAGFTSRGSRSTGGRASRTALSQTSCVKGGTHSQNRQALLQALAQPTIDRATLGDIRHAELQLADTASEQIVTALADVAEVLTPEQRIKLLEFTSRWHH
jgi:uncharacterized membrane protein